MANTRPITTEYMGSDRVAHSSTRERAVRAAAIRLIKGDYEAANVYDERGKVVARLVAMKYSMTITFTKRSWK